MLRRKKTLLNDCAKLYMVGVPIGNFDDITLRAIKTLQMVDIIYCEDTRVTKKLLNHFNIKGHLVRYDEHSKDKNGPKLIAELLGGKNVALVSDAGFPGIADPGEQLAREAIDAGIKVVPLPGANAALCALIASGLPSSPFFFGGFLPKSKKNRAEQLAAWKNIPSTIILYEAPHRIKDVLKEILVAWGDRQLAAAREITKLHEEFFRGSITECLAWLEAQPPRGEFCLVIAQGKADVQEETQAADPLDEVKALIAQGMDKKAALAQVAKARKVPKRELYNRLLAEE